MNGELKYLRIPQGKIYEVHDVFTRIDEELAEIIRGLDMIIDALYTVPRRPIYREIISQPAAPGTQEIRNILVTPRVRSIDTFDVDAPPDTFKKVNIYGDAIIITPEDDILVTGKPNAPGFPLYSGTYMFLSRTDELEHIYIKSNTGSTVKVHFMMMEVMG